MCAHPLAGVDRQVADQLEHRQRRQGDLRRELLVRVRQASPGRPLIIIPQLPQMPARQTKSNCSEGSCFSRISLRAMKSVMPSASSSSVGLHAGRAGRVLRVVAQDLESERRGASAVRRPWSKPLVDAFVGGRGSAAAAAPRTASAPSARRSVRPAPASALSSIDFLLSRGECRDGRCSPWRHSRASRAAAPSSSRPAPRSAGSAACPARWSRMASVRLSHSASLRRG